jgi:hypothetical protein
MRVRLDVETEEVGAHVGDDFIGNCLQNRRHGLSELDKKILTRMVA